jgi:hypothetical protein
MHRSTANHEVEKDADKGKQDDAYYPESLYGSNHVVTSKDVENDVEREENPENKEGYPEQ